MSESNPISIRHEAEQLIRHARSLQLATISKQGELEISYTPFLWLDEAFYIFVSELAAHTQNLLQTLKTKVLLIEDESACKNIFARKRLTLACNANLIEPGHEKYKMILDAMEQKHGKTVSVLRTLSDFHLFQLNSTKGSYIQGFGQAFQFERFELERAVQATGR